MQTIFNLFTTNFHLRIKICSYFCSVLKTSINEYEEIIYTSGILILLGDCYGATGTCLSWC